MSIKQIPAKALRKIGNAFYRIAKYIEPSVQRNPNVDRWFADHGDQTLRLQYDLNQDSVVLDLGGYEGQWASDIHAMYNCEVHIFEALPEFAQSIEQRFKKNPRLHVYSYGIGEKSKIVDFYINRNGSSMVRATGQLVQAKIVSADNFLREKNIQHVDLMKINIEGAEYALLEHLLEVGWIEHIENLQIQFHDFFPQARERMQKIQNMLRTTHELTYQYDFVWENWAKKR